MRDFFTTFKTNPPQMTLQSYLLVFALVFLIFYTAKRYYKEVWYRYFFKGLQILQLVLLYGWYILTAAPLTESLPLYHCRMAMFAVLLLPRRSPLKQYFALLGIFGTLVAFVYPVMDPFDFPHVTIFSFFVGHYALLGNALVYLLNDYDYDRLPYQKIVIYTLLLNGFLVGINLLTGGDYGFLRQPPLVGNHGVLGNYIIISLSLIVAIFLVSYVMQKYKLQQDSLVLAFKQK